MPIKYSQNAEIFVTASQQSISTKWSTARFEPSSVFSDGRPQITGFFLSGEFFGLETGNEHTLSAEAITNSTILSIKRSVLAVLAEHDKEIERRRLELAACELKRAQTHATVLILNAKERVAKFLLEMASRIEKGPRSNFRWRAWTSLTILA